MRTPLSDSQLLDAWERGQHLAWPLRPLALLAVWRQQPLPELAELPVGKRDRLLIELRAAQFGPQCDCIAACPACNTQLEFEIVLEAIRVPAGEAAPAPVNVAGVLYPILLPTSIDLLAASRESTEASARQLLAARCLGLAEPVETLPATALAELAERLAGADAQADVRILLCCQACEHEWSAVFDIGGFLWREVESWACRTLQNVHLLARGYGWSEDAILALAPLRRRAYLELLAHE